MEIFSSRGSGGKFGTNRPTAGPQVEKVSKGKHALQLHSSARLMVSKSQVCSRGTHQYGTEYDATLSTF
jgi:hypothetical protein